MIYRGALRLPRSLSLRTRQKVLSDSRNATRVIIQVNKRRAEECGSPRVRIHVGNQFFK